MSSESFLHTGNTPASPKRITIRRRLVGRGSRLRTLGLAAGLLGLGLTLSQPAHAATKNWDGSTADWYSDPAHWLPAGFPQPGDDARNTFTNAAMTLAADASVNSFISNSAFSLNNGIFSGSTGVAGPDTANLHTLQVNNIFTINGGQINNFTIAAGVQQAGAPAPSVVVNNGSLNNTVVNANVDMTQNGTGAFLRLFNTNTINGVLSLGTVNQNGSYGLRLSNGANLVFGSTGTLQGFGVVTEETAASTLTNNGLVNANASGLTLNLSQSVFNNAAGATAEATGGGILSLNNTINNSGAVKAIGANSLVGITGTFTGTGTAAQGNLITASGGGQVQINGASLLGTINTAAGTALVINGSGANNLNNTLVNGNLDMTQAGTGAFLRLLGTDTINGAITLGTVNQNGSYGLRLNNGATLLLNSGSSLTGFGVVSEETAASTLTNNGLVNANSNGNTLNLSQSVFNNAAGATAEAMGGGILSLNKTTNNSGAVKAVGTNSVVGITGTFTGAGNNLITASGGGSVQISNASLLGTINTDAATALLFTNSDNRLNNTTVNGNLFLAQSVAQGDQGEFLRLLGTDTVNGAITLGTVNQNGSYGLRLNNGATLNIGASVGNGSSLTGFGVVSEETAASTLTNNNLVNANSNGNTLNLSQSVFNNKGTAEATGGGILSLNNTTNNSAGATIAAIGKSGTNVGSVVSITGTFTGAGNNLITASGGGSVQISNASLLGTINTDAATALLFTNSDNRLNNTTVNGNLFLAQSVAQGDQGEFLRLLGTDTVNGAITLGTVNQNGSYGLRLVNGATLNIGASVGNGSSLTGFGVVSEETAASTLTNNNLVNANASGLTLTMAQTTFNNAAGATAEATNGGILSLNNTTNNSGAVKAAGGTVGITGTFTGTGSSATNLITASGGGSVQISNASLLGTINTDAATALLFTNSDNRLNNTTVNGNLFLAQSVAQGDQAEFLRLLGTDTVNGAITLGTVNQNGSYGLRLVNGANLVIGGTGSLTGFGVVSEETAASTLTNNGLVNANTIGGNSLTFNQSNFNNASSGTTQVTNGATLNVTSNSTNSGRVNVQTGGTANFNGLTQTAGLTQVDGVLNLANNTALTLNGTNKGGTLLGSGTINGNVVNTNGTVKPGDSPGTLTLNGNYAQGSGGTLNIEFLGIQNGQHDLLNVLGLASLTGTLDVNYLGSGSGIAVGSQFAFLDYSTLSAPTVGGLTQYFLNETPLTNNTGTVVGHNGFTYELINDTANNMLDLQVLTVGPPAVPEASTTVSFGLLLAFGLGGLVIAAKRKKA